MISKKAVFTPETIIIDTEQLATNCNVISFQNKGDVDLNITLGGGEITLKTTDPALILGFGSDVVLEQTFNVEFQGTTNRKLVVLRGVIEDKL